jgi:hypothetical protein
MKHIQPFVLFEAKSAPLPSGLTQSQEKFLNRHTPVLTWKVNPTTGLVDVQRYFDCSNQRQESFQGISFGHVSGHFFCSNNELTSLKGAPQTVGGDFSCSYNDLTSLEGAPQTVGGDFNCFYNYNLKSLEGAPRTVGVNFLSDEFQLEEGEWNMQGWLEVLNTGTEEAKKLISTLPWLQPDWWNLELQRDPGKTVHLLGSLWKHMPKDMQSAIKIPRGYEDDFELFSGFNELGLF